MDREILELIDKYSLNSVNLEELKDIVFRGFTDSHPDKTAGEFPNDETRNRHLDFSRLNEYLKNKENDVKNYLVKRKSEITAYNVEKKKLDSEMLSSQELKLESKKTSGKEMHKKKYRSIKITSTTFTAILSTVWVLPDTLTENTLIAPLDLTSSTDFLVTWLAVMVITVLLWLRMLHVEARYSSWLEQVTSVAYQNYIFQKFFPKLKEEFTASDLVDEMFKDKEFKKQNSNNLSVILIYARMFESMFGLQDFYLDYDFAFEIAQLILIKAKSNNVIIVSQTQTDLLTRYKKT